MSPMYYRLSPFYNKCPVSMFTIRDALGLELIQGDNWGHDFLVAPDDVQGRALVEGILQEEGVFFEKYSKAVFHPSYKID